MKCLNTFENTDTENFEYSLRLDPTFRRCQCLFTHVQYSHVLTLPSKIKYLADFMNVENIIHDATHQLFNQTINPCSNHFKENDSH